MRKALVALAVLTLAIPVVPAIATTPSTKTSDMITQVVRDHSNGQLPATVLVNGVPTPWTQAMALLDQVTQPTTNGIVAPTGDYGTGQHAKGKDCYAGFAYAFSFQTGSYADTFTSVDQTPSIADTSKWDCFGTITHAIGPWSGNLGSKVLFAEACLVTDGALGMGYNAATNTFGSYSCHLGSKPFSSIGFIGDVATEDFKFNFFGYYYHFTDIFVGGGSATPANGVAVSTLA